MSEETIQGEHRKPLFQRLRDICGCLTTEDDCDEIARVVFKSYTVVFESYPTNEKMSEGKHKCLVCNDVRKQLRGLPESKLHGDDGLAAATMRGFNRLSENEDKWQAKYKRLNLSLAKNKRLFSDEYSQSVIESQVKRITQLEDDLSFVRCELDKLRKETR
jgi:hypothetical protein